MANGPQFIEIPVSELTVSLKDFQGRSEEYSSVTYGRIVKEVRDGTFNFSALPAIMVWKDIRTGKWVILAGHSRTAAFRDLSAGKHPINPAYKKSDFAKIHAQVFVADDYNSALEQAKKVAQESNLAGQQSNIDFAYKVVKPLRESSKNMSKYWEKMEDLFGANKMAVHKLSFLNPDGKTVAMLRATKDLSDRQQKAIVETIAEYIGRARERMPELTNQHETELYDWLVKVFANPDEAAKKKIGSESKFLDLVASRIMRLGWSPDQPLNLELVGAKSIYEQTYDQIKAEKEDQIKELQKEYNAKKDALIKLDWPIEKIEEKLDSQEKYIIRLQKELARYIQGYSQVEIAAKNELNLFDAPPPPPPPAQAPAEVKQYQDKLMKLAALLRLKQPAVTSLEKNEGKIGSEGTMQEEDEKQTAQARKDNPQDYREPKKKSFADFISRSRRNEISDNLLQKPYLELKELLADTKKKFDRKIGMGQQDHQLRKTVWDLQELVAAHEKANNLNQMSSKLLAATNIRKDLLLQFSNGEFLLEQLDYWLTEFEARSDERQYRKYMYKGGEYDPHIIRQTTGYADVDMLKQICETAIHIFANSIIESSHSQLESYERLCQFYKIQPRVKWRSTKSVQLQQYSTPIPIAYLMSRFCTEICYSGRNGSFSNLHGHPVKFFEPTAGTGLLTIGTNPKHWTVNEIDQDRLFCLKVLGFSNTTSQDALLPFPYGREFDAVIANPPFQENPAISFDGYKIKRKEFIIAANALNCMMPKGRAAIIIGGAMKYDDQGLITPFYTDGVFFNWLYRYYNVVDVISLSPDFYVQMGAITKIRIILIDGLGDGEPKLPPKKDAELTADQPNSPFEVKDFNTLYARMSRTL